MSMCVRDYIPHHVERSVSAAHGQEKWEEEQRKYTATIDNYNSIGQREQEYELQMYKNPMSMQISDTH